MEKKEPFRIMLDLETLGVTPGCGILAIGATSLDFKHRFYDKISPQSNKSYRLFTDPSTLEWWNKQSDEARNESFSGYLDLAAVLQTFNIWLSELPLEGRKLEVWGNGADFDLPILRVAYKETKIKDEIPPFAARCYRTIKEMFPEIEKPKFVGAKHTAIADARNQAEHLLLLLEKLRNR